MNPRKPVPQGIKVGRRGVISSRPIPLEVVQRIQREEEEQQRRRQGQEGGEATGEQPETGAGPTAAGEAEEGREVDSSDDEFFDAEENVVESESGEGGEGDEDFVPEEEEDVGASAAVVVVAPASTPTKAEIAEARAGKRRADSPAPAPTAIPKQPFTAPNTNITGPPSRPHTPDCLPIVPTNAILADAQYAYTTEMYREFLASNNDPATNDTMTAGDYLETERNQALQLKWHRQEKMTEGRYNPIVSADAAEAFGRVLGAVGRWVEDDVREGREDGVDDREREEEQRVERGEDEDEEGTEED